MQHNKYAPSPQFAALTFPTLVKGFFDMSQPLEMPQSFDMSEPFIDMSDTFCAESKAAAAEKRREVCLTPSNTRLILTG